MANPAPLVSIGIPTYNRVTMLERAVRSVLDQDYRHIEVVVSDNRSSDGTQVYCEALAALDDRVRYIRQPANIGPVANHRVVFENSHGEYYMVMGDDDWLEASYISRCLVELEAHRDTVLVGGRPRMYREGAYCGNGSRTNLLQSTGIERVLAYYSSVRENGSFHGIIRRDLLRGIPLMPNAMGGDWLYIAAIAFAGKIRTIDTTTVNKALGGATVSYRKIATSGGLSRFQGEHPFLSIISSAFKDIAWVSPVYKSLGTPRRWLFASRVLLTLALKFIIIHPAHERLPPWLQRLKRPFHHFRSPDPRD